METATTEVETADTTLTLAERAARTFIRVKQAQADAKKAYDAGRKTLIEAFDAEGVEEVFIDDHKVDVVKVTNREFDLTKLEGIIPATIFRQVVKVSIDTEAFDKAVADGLIALSVEQEVVTPKQTLRVDAKKGVVGSLEELVK
jgi:hypothetical protein